MSTRVVDRVDDWDQRPFSGGYGELQTLADEEFSGVVRAGGAELFVTKGTVVGIRRGSIEDFADASGTVYEAPYPALPLLAIMQERSDEVRAQYYTEETPLSEVDGTLEDGGFTGYVELSENVLSGDYYQVYHGGHSMSAAYVGEAQRLLTGDEAFETADDEVGIYEVRPVDVDAIEIPEPDDAGGAEEAAVGAGAEAADGTPPESVDDAVESADAGSAVEDPEGAADDAGRAGDAVDVAEAESGGDGPTDDGGSTAEAAAGASAAGGSTTGSATGASSTGGAAESAASIPDAESDGGGSAGSGSSTSASAGAGTSGGTSRSEDRTSTRQDAGGETTAGGSGAGSGAAGTAASSRQPTPSASGDGSHLETRSIPSLDPERTKTRQRSSPSSGGPRGDSPGRTQRGQATEAAGSQGTSEQSPEAPASDQQPAEESTDRADEPGADASPEAGSAGDVPADVEAELERKEAEIERLEAELAEATGGQDDLEAELEAVREERDELQEKVDQLETELERLEEEFGAATDAEQRLTAQEALSGTDVFVRYHSKGDATLEKAHDGSVRREDVTDNLRLEKHTQFDANAVAVGGQAYDEFLERTVEYQFVKWVVEHLLFEIRDTGHAEALQTLYDALPKVDRAELNGVVNVVITEDGQETRTQEGFDVVLRDRMGNPLLVANLNDSREAATEGMMEGLVTSAERVGQSSETLACAFLVTRSFFEPEALETASEATRGGLLSRDKRRSFVNLSRKRGYHLCLVEARNENFHLAVPEL